MPVLLIRHAHAESRKDWAGDDRLRPLSALGLRQAAALVETLGPLVAQRILSSPYERCRRTVAPLAEALGLSVELTEDLAEGSVGASLALVRAHADEKIAMCTHGDVIPEVLVAIADEDRVDLGVRPRQEKGSVWVLEASSGRFVRATYLGPPA